MSCFRRLANVVLGLFRTKSTHVVVLSTFLSCVELGTSPDSCYSSVGTLRRNLSPVTLCMPQLVRHYGPIRFEVNRGRVRGLRLVITRKWVCLRFGDTSPVYMVLCSFALLDSDVSSFVAVRLPLVLVLTWHRLVCSELRKLNMVNVARSLVTRNS